jgi:hypothetical protein
VSVKDRLIAQRKRREQLRADLEAAEAENRSRDIRCIGCGHRAALWGSDFCGGCDDLYDDAYGYDGGWT